MTSCFSSLFGRKVRSSVIRDPEIDEELSGVHNVILYTYKELSTATEDFSPANKIGEGGFGSVYKGKLKDGKIAAIKVLAAESRQGVQEFLTEIKVISEIEHENLVKLYGCCVEGNHRILVYNYLENNSLAQTLLGGRQSNIFFNWQTRSRICIGIARGLAFLHEEVRPHIVHRDIKASNILLDKELTPKISDFGLAKLIPPNMTHVSTRVAGTIGYLAPEYAVRGQVNRKADIYSFGVLLLEIVSGRCNTNTRLPEEEQFLLERTWRYYQQRILVGLVDTSLNGEFDAEEACKFLKVGLLCTQEVPKLRPPMSSVVKMLTGKMDVDDSKITEPGLISDLMDLKVKGKPKNEVDMKTLSSYNASSSSDFRDTTMSSAASTVATTTSAVRYDHSM
ncbi:cold-responsive protein kinase 1-like isoform X2 [Prosopis cineraria]|uniref:cold-responsive protein kinase 1-like isoform X2 n=1 Tax=Prosopis cineraria TaxID=364024 RepID=UPI00240F16D6|nr:cold-responsive protein kinase 1-like isoform X2 [Prosopis cineraria]XP_054814650.1 cold-responsive protein kinase 1-like isoform X2 [Prosopis cineraria]